VLNFFSLLIWCFYFVETEKYAHVTFFFNGGVEQQFDKEDRLMVASPKVATYDLQPEMSVAGVAKTVSITILIIGSCDLVQVADAVASGKYPFVMCNLAPPDMVGHTGVYNAAVKACEATGNIIIIVVITTFIVYFVTILPWLRITVR